MKKGKRLLSALLTLCMIATIVPTYMFASAEETVTPLEASRLTEEELPGWNIVYFGTAAATLSEDDAVYSVPIYREGDLSGEASVEVRTVDLTALRRGLRAYRGRRRGDRRRRDDTRTLLARIGGA